MDCCDSTFLVISPLGKSGNVPSLSACTVKARFPTHAAALATGVEEKGLRQHSWPSDVYDVWHVHNGGDVSVWVVVMDS